MSYIYIYFKTSGSFWKYYRDGPGVNNANDIIDFPANNNYTNTNNNSISIKFKEKISLQTENDGTKDV